ncbi:MAG: hypothetical protein ACREH8_07775, partial [Opitutaceae bacterium]
NEYKISCLHMQVLMNLSMSLHGQAFVDASSLLAFAAIERLDLLSVAFPVLWLPSCVQREIAARDFRPNMLLREAILRKDKIRTIETPPNIRELIATYLARVDPGESEVIAMAKVRNQPAVIDDQDARLLAVSEGVRVIGSLGILAHCKNVGAIAYVKPYAEAMRAAGRYFSLGLLRDFYRNMGEG